MTKKVIYKYELDVNSDANLGYGSPSGVDYFRGTAKMPKNAEVISAGTQAGTVVVWAEVDMDSVADTQVDFLVVPTGGVVHGIHTFINTVFSGPFVWHIYWIRHN